VKNEIKYSNLIAKYLSGNLGKSEKKELFYWVEKHPSNQAFFDEMVQLWSASKNIREEPFNANVADAWSQIESKLDTSNNGNPSTAKIVNFSLSQSWWRVAAIGLFLIAVGWWFLNKTTQTTVIQTIANEQLEWKLPDGSKVWLNENTTLSYNPDFSERLVYLEGEAFFEVEKLDKKLFEIVSGDTKTTVLGTAFNLRAYPKEELIEVTVDHGLVAISDKKAENFEVKLQKGESGIFNKSIRKIEKSKTPISNAKAWKTKTLEFDDTELKNAIPALERFFETNIEVENSAILNCHFTSTFPPKTDILTVLKVMEAMTMENVKFESQNGGYLLKGEGCN
jgi:ferric-dicitrate binding protein FerR (iron transport regulator)